MKYISTRGNAPAIGFDAIISSGLAPDGGLYLPETFPQFSLEDIYSWQKLSYPQLAFKIIRPYTGTYFPDADLKKLIDTSYAGFTHKEVAPLTKLRDDQYLLELFHGPTLAFKDFALQLLGNMLDYSLAKKKLNVVIVGATSGDTGSAAIEGCRKSKYVKIFMLHPHNRTSAIQRRQMTTVKADNIFNIAVEGNFDDCQHQVKEMFSHPDFARDIPLVAVNSINWVRIMAQIVYYFYAFLRLPGKPESVTFSVPTGNFGDVFAGYVAKEMGLPVKQLIVATNTNDILHRFFKDNDYSKGLLTPTLSPSMDIQVSSNFERMLYLLHSRDGKKVAELMDGFRKNGKLSVADDVITKARSLFVSQSTDDAKTLTTIQNLYKDKGIIVCPHTATGIASAALASASGRTPVVALATAHAAKFPEAIKKAGISASTPPKVFEKIFDKTEHFTVLPNDFSTLTEFIGRHI